MTIKQKIDNIKIKKEELSVLEKEVLDLIETNFKSNLQNFVVNGQGKELKISRLEPSKYDFSIDYGLYGVTRNKNGEFGNKEVRVFLSELSELDKTTILKVVYGE